MSEPACRSEIARLMRQISEANEAAYQALYGLAQGTAQPAFITARMERMGEYHEQLVELVGEHEAALLVCRALDGAGRCRGTGTARAAGVDRAVS